MPFASGDSLYLPIMNGKIPHLWVVLTDPDANEHILAVNFTSFTLDKDQTVILNIGDHPYITRKSIASFQDARLLSVPFLQDGIKKGLVQRKELCPSCTLNKLRTGLLTSPFSPDKMCVYLQEQLKSQA